MIPPNCKDCLTEGVTTARPTPHPGPRCVTHHRARRKITRARAHARHVATTYGITDEDYAALYESQGGRCAICRRATGATKRLAVDHDHRSGLVRGLLCGPCNITIGRLSASALATAFFYLQTPPAPSIIGQRIVPSTSPTTNGVAA